MKLLRQSRQRSIYRLLSTAVFLDVSAEDVIVGRASNEERVCQDLIKALHPVPGLFVEAPEHQVRGIGPSRSARTLKLCGGPSIRERFFVFLQCDITVHICLKEICEAWRAYLERQQPEAPHVLLLKFRSVSIIVPVLACEELIGSLW